MGGKDVDTLLGGDGNDRLVVSGSDSGTDTMNCGAGSDTLVVAGKLAVTLVGFNALAFSIEGWEGNGAGVIGTAVAEAFDLSGIAAFSGTGLGFLDAGSGADTVIGSGFAEDLRGAAGNDIIRAGSGNDTVDGGVGNDLLQGGTGATPLSSTRAKARTSSVTSWPGRKRGTMSSTSARASSPTMRRCRRG